MPRLRPSGTSTPKKFFLMASVCLYVLKVVLFASLRFGAFYLAYRLIRFLFRSWRNLGKHQC